MAYEQAQTVKNDQKWPKMEFFGKWRENGVINSNSVSESIIATASSDNSFVNKRGDGAKRLLTNRHKWCKW